MKPAKQQDRVLVACPQCGHAQPEPRTAFSSVCRKCGQYFRVQELLNPAPETPRAAPASKHVLCFECGAELEVPVSAESTMCKRCSRYVDLKDYQITTAISKNFKTKGRFVVEPRGYVFNSETLVSEAVIKGRFLGKLTAERSLTIYSSAEIKGSFNTALLVIPPGNRFRRSEPIRVGGADIAGELAADLQATGKIVLRSTALLFGNLVARHLVVEDGAVVVGKIGVCCVATDAASNQHPARDIQASVDDEAQL